MAKNKNQKNKSKSKLKATKSRKHIHTPKAIQAQDVSLVFNKKNYLYVIGGFALILLGLLLMSGGAMPSPDVWDEHIIYSFVRITLAPIIILAGLIVEVIAIFK